MAEEILEGEQTEEVGIILKDRDGNDVEHMGVNIIEVPTTDGGVQEFVAGEVVERTINPNFSDGDIEVAPDEGQFLSKVTIVKPINLSPENILKDVAIAGVVGTLESGGDDEFTPYANGANNKTWRIENILPYMFYSNSTLTREVFTNVSKIGSSAFYSAKITSVDFPVCTQIESHAFRGCPSLAKISFPKCVSIGQYAFYQNYALTEAVFPMCTSVPYNAFALCSAMQKADFQIATTISSGAFTSCSSLKEANFPECLSIANGASTTGAFRGCSKLTTISFPKCTNVGSFAFGCPTLSSVYLPECVRLESGAFSGCYSLANVVLPKCEHIGTSAFYYCYNLKSISAPAVKTISYAAFSASNLTVISFPACTSMGSAPFVSANKASLINLPKCGYIDNHNSNFAFCKSVCSALTMAYLPVLSSKLQYIFMSCSNLDTVVIGGGANGLGSSAIYSCHRLRSLYITSTVLTPLQYAPGTVFGSSPIYSYSAVLGDYGSIYVRETLYPSYIAATYWSSMSARIVAIPDEEMDRIRNGEIPSN